MTFVAPFSLLFDNIEKITSNVFDSFWYFLGFFNACAANQSFKNIQTVFDFQGLLCIVGDAF